jgi:hypothetical protein
MQAGVYKFFLLLLLATLFAFNANAEEKPEEHSELEKSLIESNKAISEWFDSVAEGVDLFLVGKKISNTKNTSKITLDNTTYSRESRNLSNLTTLSVNPRFTNLEAYWNLKFSNYDQSSTIRRTDGGYARQTPQEQNYGATIGLFRKLNNLRFAFQPRIELQDPLKVSHSLSVESVAAIDRLQINPKFEFFANASKGTGTTQALNFNYTVSEVYSLTLVNEAEYEDKVNKYSVTNAVNLGQLLSESTALTYGVTFYSNNRPNYHLDAYSFSVVWSQVVYKNILDYQVGPHMDFVQDEDFKGFVGGMFNLRVHF